MELFKGIITPIVTPFLRDEAQTINDEALKQHIDWLIERGVNGIFVLGSNGEFHMLDHDEKVHLVKKAVEYAGGRVPVYAGAGACSTQEAIRLAKAFEQAGADALSVINPWFLNLKENDLYEHYKQIAASTSLPIVLYNIPKGTGQALEPALVEKLADIENIQAIKDSSGKPELIEAYASIASQHDDFDLLIGSDSKISLAYKKGASGAVAGTSNLIPDVLVSLDQALRAGDDVLADYYQRRIEPLRAVLPMQTVPSVLKKAVELAGIAPVGAARKPVHEPDEDQVRQIQEMVDFYYE